MTKKCSSCSSGLLMLDGNTWCGITIQPESGDCLAYNSGLPKLYKPEPIIIDTEKAVKKTIKTQPKVKLVQPKTQPVKTSKKTPSTQQKLF